MVVLNDSYLEKQIEAEGKRRGHATMAKTLSQLVHERLMQIDPDPPRITPSPSPTRRAEKSAAA